MEELLNEYRASLLLTIEKRIAELIDGCAKQPERALELYTEIIARSLRNDNARVSTDAVHKAITSHIGNVEGFMIELLQIQKTEATAANERAIEIVNKAIRNAG